MSRGSPRLSAMQLIDEVLDAGTFTSWDAPQDHTHLDANYQAELSAAQEKSGVDDSVITGRGEIDGLSVAVIVGEFRFLGGSIGAATAARIVAATRRATREGLPLLASTASGGTRMQEGTPAFVEMVTITRAIIDHKAAGLPYLVYLRHPTTGGVFASWGSLGHLTAAEPGALVGFLGPKVYEALNGHPFPPGVQLAENLAEHGVIDAVVAPSELANVAARTLRLIHPMTRASGVEVPGNRSGVVPDPDSPTDVSTAARDTTSTRGTPTRETPVQDATPAQDAWEAVELTRRADRPGVRDLLTHAADDVVALSGTGEGQRDDGVLVALTSFQGQACVLIGQDRQAQSTRPMGPDALRQARRGMRLAQQLNLPLVSVIDTPGADLSKEAEEGALAGEIARSIAELTQLTVPSVALILGQGCGGGALAMLPAKRVIVAESGWLSPLPPEGASVIVHGNADHADEMTRRQRVASADLVTAGIAHRIVPEPAAAHEDPVAFCQAMASAAVAEVRAQLAAEQLERLAGSDQRGVTNQ